MIRLQQRIASRLGVNRSIVCVARVYASRSVSFWLTVVTSVWIIAKAQAENNTAKQKAGRPRASG